MASLFDGVSGATDSPEEDPVDRGELLDDVPLELIDGTAAEAFELVEVEPASELAIVRAIGPGLNIQALLSFLPDVRLKQKLEGAAASALAIEVTGDTGLSAADTAADTLRTMIDDVDLCFDGTKEQPGPTALAYALHKRLTGLRSDFTKEARDALDTVNRRIYAEQKRMRDAADNLRRQQQAEADARARDAARDAELAAREHQAPEPVIAALAHQARTATAPPVQVRGPAKLAKSSAVEARKARLIGTLEGDEPNPASDQMTAPQLASFRFLLLSIVEGHQSPSLVNPNWSALNGRASGDGAAFNVPGMETYVSGSVRRKAGRR